MNSARTEDENHIRSFSKMMLWVNSGCNAHCRSCDIWREPKGRSLTLNEIRKWAPEWKALSLETVVICGEPLMHNAIWEVIEELRTFSFKIELLTNGLLLERYAANVVQSCDEVRVSLDGPEDIHNKMRGVRNAFQRLRDGLAAVHAILPSFPIDGRCHVHLQNFRYLKETTQAAKDIGISSLSFSGTDFSNQEAFRRSGAIDDSYIQEFIIAGEALLELQKELETFFLECSEDFRSRFLSDAPDKLRTLILDYYRELSGGPKRILRCNSPWTSVVLEYDGTVRPCFPMPAYGNLKDYDSMCSALNSTRALKFREELDVSSSYICRRCVDQTVNPRHPN